MPDDEDRLPSEPQTISSETVEEGEAAQLGSGTDRLSAPEPRPVAETLAPQRWSAMPIILTLIGLIVIGLLGANLYAVYNPPANDAIPAMQSDLAKLKQDVSALPKVDLTPVEARVAALASATEQLKVGIPDGAAAAAAARSAGAKADEAKTAIASLEQKVAALDAGVGDVRSAIAALPKIDLAPLVEKQAALDQRLVPLETYVNAPKNADHVTEARQNGSAAETRAAPVALIAQSISATLPTGRPFPIELKALTTLGVDPGVVQPLAVLAATGAATDADLVAGFAGLRDALVLAAAPVPLATGTMLDRIMANAASVVTVKQTGAAPGDDVGAIAARIEAALKRGAPVDALSDWEKLPEASKARSSDWAARLKARVAAEAAAHTIAAAALNAVAAAAP